MGLFFIMMAINIVVRVTIGFVQMKRAGKKQLKIYKKQRLI